ncbi:N(5)-(carboxyethyl)ornithine synthase [Acinetobacter gerneri]|uniref:N(5)-(carboxyethyl)ornithine synthase n=1 Tax=Acinetobacter gerneri TaxID=202952 RepID=UPI0029358168|nr:N(5)-(carboxyethyl)ornithine synthase [Acinetobacter gerneri]MDV2440812.1 N(5)-(carboxyethyl)ornithine synthase [Acinetobacter gerneri]
MKTIGFPISDKENENRRAIIPNDLVNISNVQYIYIEQGYGDVLGYSDNDYINLGAKVVSRNEVLQQDIICDPKIGDAKYLDELNEQTIFGWVHAVQNKNITDKLINNKLTAYAWEDMFDQGRHIFWRNNEIAGEAAIVHAYTLHGLFPYNTKVALLGRGNIARGAFKILTMMGADVTVYDRRTEDLFRSEIGKYDVLVNGILWDTSRKDHIIYKTDLKKMKKGALIIDISCDKNGGIESSVPTNLDNPIYVVDDIVHYAVDHTPTLFYKTISHSLSESLSIFLNHLIEEKNNSILDEALIVNNGMVIDQRINDFQGR